MPAIAAIHHIGITVTDIERSVPWYCNVLELTKLMDAPHPDGHGHGIVLGKRDWSMCVGLHTHDTNDKARFTETATGLDHVSFLVADRAALDAWEARLTDLGVEHAPVEQQDGYAALVFRDPDNIQLELFTLG